MKTYIFSQKITVREYFKVKADSEKEAKAKMEQLDYEEHIDNADDYLDCDDFKLEEVED